MEHSNSGQTNTITMSIKIIVGKIENWIIVISIMFLHFTHSLSLFHFCNISSFKSFPFSTKTFTKIVIRFEGIDLL
jgi:energy-converting hydrogenase Eha subunit E